MQYKYISPTHVSAFIECPESELIDNPVLNALTESHKRILRLYANHLKLIDFAKGSFLKYTSDICRFLAWLYQSKNIADISQITIDTIRAYEKILLSQKKKGTPNLLNARTRCVLVAVMKHFLTYLFKKEILTTNFTPFIEMPRVSNVFVRETVSEDEIQRMLDLPTGNDPKRIRNKAMIQLLYSTGIRNSELRDLTIHDLDFKENQLIVRKGKGNKPRLLPIGKKAINTLEDYLLLARPRFMNNKNTDTLFLSYCSKEKLSIWGLSDIVVEMGKEAGINKLVTPHMIRHSFATHMLNNECDIRYIQSFLGHSRITTTEVYTHCSIERLKKIHAATHPLEKHA